MYGFHDFEKNDRSLTRHADGFFRLSVESPIDIQGFIYRAHIIRAEYMAETMRSLARSARARLRSFGRALRGLPAGRPRSRFGQKPNCL